MRKQRNSPMIRRARSEDAAALSGIAFRSKAHWGYSDEFMEACREELAVTPEYLEHSPAFVLVDDGEPIGFYALERISDRAAEVGFFFVEPSEIRRGHGAALMDHACRHARALRYEVLIIQSDPDAEGFYLACGARRVGMKPSASIPNRSLPLLELELGDT